MTQQNIVHEGLIRGQKMNHVYQAHTLDVIRTTGNNNVALRMKSVDALSQRCSRLKKYIQNYPVLPAKAADIEEFFFTNSKSSVSLL